MNFQDWYKLQDKLTLNELNACIKGWDSCKLEVIKLLEKNKELETVSYDGKMVYKIYGTVIDKIKKL